MHRHSCLIILVSLLVGGVSAALPKTVENVLNFALNLECLEAQFYGCAVYGTSCLLFFRVLCGGSGGGGHATTSRPVPAPRRVAWLFLPFRFNHYLHRIPNTSSPTNLTNSQENPSPRLSQATDRRPLGANAPNWGRTTE